MTPALTFRPHHFLCALGFQGRGYSDRFTDNMAGIVDQLRGPNGDRTVLHVTFQADRICAPCPHRRGSGCEKSFRITALDERHAAALSLTDGQALTWAEAKARIVSHVPPGALHDLCQGCQWLALGLCETALSQLHAEHKRGGSTPAP